jgi:glycosyltransferase involved in cell wall biosynthesis
VTSAEPLHIHFLDSWIVRPWEGSGTAVGIAGLRKGLEALGHRVETIRPDETPSPDLARRLLFNARLPARLLDGPSADLVVGFDIDGLLWGRARGRTSPYLVVLKGVAADEARFAASRTEALQLRLMAALEKRNVRKADGMLVSSRHSARVVEKEYGIPADRIRVVPEAVDSGPFEELRRSPPPRPDRPTILTVARQYPRKDTATLLRALPVIRERIPDVHLRVIGGGPQLHRLMALARGLEITPAVTFEGAVVDGAEVRRAYFEAHVFCLPSLQEGFGIAFVEAMAAGLPVVAARAGAVSELVEEGRTGILVPSRSPEILATALVHLLEKEDERRRLGEAGPERARRFAPERVAGEFLDAARSLAGGTLGSKGTKGGSGEDAA